MEKDTKQNKCCKYGNFGEKHMCMKVKAVSDWEVAFDKKFTGNQRYNIDGCIRDSWYLKDRITTSEIKDFIHSTLSSHTAELKERVENLPENFPHRESDEYDKGAQYMKDKVLWLVSQTFSLLDNK